MKINAFSLIALIIIVGIISTIGMTKMTKSEQNKESVEKNDAKVKKSNLETEKATLAGGCFWCMQPPYDNLPGVISTTVGYTGGHIKNPTYDQVISGTTGHLEAVEIVFDPKKIQYETILDVFWKNIDPTNLFGQFADTGPQYLTAIFFHSKEQQMIALNSIDKLNKSGLYDKPIVTTVRPSEVFYTGEEYHQEYYKKNPLRYQLYKQGSGRDDYIKKRANQ